MQFDLTGFLIFLCFILPGFLAQKARDSLTPRSLKPQSLVADVGEFVLAGVWVHVLLVAGIRLFFLFLAKQYFALFENNLRYGSLHNFLWGYRHFVFGYLVASLILGYALGWVQGWLILKQPVRTWALGKKSLAKLLRRLGIPGFLQEQPVWYFVFQQRSPSTQVFLEVEMKDGAGFYTGELKSYGILADSEKSKDFYMVDVHFKRNRPDAYTPLQCDGLLLSFEDVATIQVVKIDG